MNRLVLLLPVAFSVFLSSCSETAYNPINTDDTMYPLKECSIERDPKINVWGFGIDFFHTQTDSDYQYLTATSIFPYDLKFYVVKVYYKDANGDTKTEGSPAILLSSTTQGCKVGEGTAFFDSLTQPTTSMINLLKYEPVINYSTIKDSAGLYNRTALFASLDNLIIGQKFRSGVLIIPSGKTEAEVQPVYLLKTAEGVFVKFMVTQFKGVGPDEKRTFVKWKIIKK